MKYLYHYTYRITNTKLNKHYYGTKSCNDHPKLNLGFLYFSSSRDVDFLKDQKLNPQDYKYKIIKIYNDRVSALNLEIKLHHKFNVGINPNFYNKSKQLISGFDTTGCVPHNKGKPMSEEQKSNLRIKATGRSVSKETREKLRRLNKGKKRSNETKERLSESKKGALNHMSKEVSISGIIYESVGHASRELNIHKDTLYSRIKSSSSKWVDYFYLEKLKPFYLIDE